MKKGLTYISERTGQLRYANNQETEEWVQQTSTYIPIVEIKRGQPVSVATVDDLKRVASDDEDLYNALLESSDSFVVLTNPSRHSSSIGLALEYTSGVVELVDGELSVQPKIHILGQGKYIEDKDYYANAFTESDSVDVSSEEYWPEFFNDYENSIGKKVYVKGSADGQLTLVKEEAYLAHNQVIVVGFVADAKLTGKEGQLNVGAIEIQIEGDDRGILDATTFEAVIGETVYIGKNRVQVNGEENSATKVFALGAEDDEKFNFTFNINQPVNTTMPKGFIAIQRWDGKTAYIYTNGEISKDELLTNEDYDYNDRAFWQVAQYYAVNCEEEGTKIAKYDLACSKLEDLDIANLQTLLKAAMVFVAPEADVSLKDGRTTQITDLVISSLGNGHYECTANDVGGYFDIYISNNITKYFSDLNTASHGSYYNRGYAVLADIRNPKRQNIIGIYNSGHEGIINKLENALFIKQGLFEDSSAPYEVGERYYLGSHGNIFKVPQEYYNSIISIGYAQDDSHLIVDCCDSRQYNNGDLPVGYMKPSVKGNAEFGFWLMDGTTPHKVEDAETFVQRLQNWYDKSELNIQVYNFGTTDEPDYAQGFIIPKVEYQRHTGEDSVSYEPAQIKYLAEGVYKEMPRMPFVRRYVEFGGTESHTTIPDIDITPLMIYGPEEDRIQVPDLESLDIKLFANLSDDTENNVRNWTQIEPGFHQSDNFTYYGFKWTVMQTQEPSANHPYGTWVIRAAYTGTASADEPDNYPTSLGICYRADPYAPAMPLAGRKARVFVTKHDYYSRQFDVEALFKDYVKESVVDASDTPWKSNAVSGQAVREDIWNKVHTKDLALGTEEINANVEGYLSTLNIIGSEIKNEDDLVNRRIKSTFRLANSDSADDATPFIDYWNGLLKFYYENETGDNIQVNKAHLKSTILNNGYALMPSFIYKEHHDTLVENGVENNESFPHGIKNTGWTGNLNAKTLQSANLGYPQHILSNNASEEDSFTYTEATNKTVRITIPYTQKETDGRFTTRLGDHTKYYNDTYVLLDEYLDLSADDKEITKQLNVRAGYNFVLDFFGSKDSSTAHILTKFDFANKKIEFVDDDDSPITLNGDFSQTSSIKAKYAYTLFETSATPETLPEGYEDKFKNEESNLNEALQAIYEMPLATFKYDREDDNEYYKKYFGIIVERVAQTKKNIEESEIKNSTTLDNVEYEYTDDEKASIAEYLKMVTDNNEEAMRTSSVVGILLKAAKETQERLLNLEISTFGKDSPTLPGADTPNENFTANDQKSTIAGLNRLVKALCREVFQDADPTSIDNKGAWSEGSENYSRLDMLDKEVNGEAAKEDSATRITLNETSTYPDDATITETVEYSHSSVSDSDNDNDFEKGTQYPQKPTYTYTKDQIDDFDGLNDAVNRIVAKLNQLTTDVVGEDDIKQRPKKLDYIRSSLETLVRELYDDNTEAQSIENGAYVKSTLSRIDKLLQALYNFDLNYGSTKSKTTFNSKTLYGEKKGVEEDSATFSSFSSRSPESVSDIFKNASILDVIIDLLGTEEKNLVRTSQYDWKDSNKNANGWKLNGSEQATTYQVLANEENNKNNRHHEDILTRLDDIEKSLSMMFARVTNSTDFRTDVERTSKNGDTSGSYAGITSIDDLLYDWSDTQGLTHDKNGVYSNKRESISVHNDDGTETSDYRRTDQAKKVTAEQWNRPLHSTVNDFDTYDIIYDMVARIKNSEWNNAYINGQLGSDFDDYVDGKYSKTNYENLAEDSPSYSPKYTVTSDMKAVLKLLYGADSSDNMTTYSHFEVENENKDNFTSSAATKGVSVLDELYNMLYYVPRAYKDSGTTGTTQLFGNYENIYKEALYYDPNTSKVHKAAEKSLLGNGHRSTFIASAGTSSTPRNRIEILEDWAKAIYNFVGFGTTSDQNYFKGNLGIQFGNADNNTSLYGGSSKSGQVVSINSNSNYGVSSVYKNLNLKDTSNYKLSAISLQGYFNSLDIVAVLGSNTSSGWKYKKPDAIANDDNSKIQSCIYPNEDTTIETVYTVKDAIDKLYDWTATLDKSIMSLQAVDKSYQNSIDTINGILGSDWIDSDKTVLSRLSSLDSEVSTLSISLSKEISDRKSEDTSLRESIKKNAESITSNEARIEAIEDAKLSSGAISLSNDDADVIYKKASMNTTSYTVAIPESVQTYLAESIITVSVTKTDENNYEISPSKLTTQDGVSITMSVADSSMKFTVTKDGETETTDTTTETETVPLTPVVSSDNIITVSSQVESMNTLISSIQSSMKQYADEAAARAQMYAYLRCNSITCNGTTITLARNNSSTVFNTGDSDEGQVTIGNTVSIRAGDSYYYVTVKDDIDNVTLSAYIPVGTTTTTDTATSYKHNSYETVYTVTY